jgi:DNA-binding IclR family transcriptional regulator
MGKIDDIVHEFMKNTKESLTLKEIAERVGQPEKKVYKALRKLFENGQLESRERKYKFLDK